MIDNKTIRQVVINSKLFPCNAKQDITVDGSIANFETDEATPLKSCICYINPTQSGTGDPSPTNSRPITGVSSVNVVNLGSLNFWNELWEIGSLTTSGSDYSSTTRIRSIGYTQVPPNTIFYMCSNGQTADIHFYDENKAHLSYVQKSNTTFTTPTGTRYIRFCMAVTYGTTYNDDISINYPSTDTTYHAFVNSSTLTPVSLGQTVYGGEVDVVGGEGISNYGYLVLDGSEDWDLYYMQNGFALSISDMKIGSAMQGYSNFLPTITSSSQFGIRFGGSTNNNIIYCCRIMGEIEGVTDLETWKTYLSTNNLIICYPLETPETFSVDPETLETLEGINNIWHDANGNIEIVYEKECGTCNGIMKFLPIFYPSGKD